MLYFLFPIFIFRIETSHCLYIFVSRTNPVTVIEFMQLLLVVKCMILILNVRLKNSYFCTVVAILVTVLSIT